MPKPDKKEEILKYVTDRYSSHLLPPTMDEIAQHLGLKAVSNIHRQLRSLVEEGRLVEYQRKYLPSGFFRKGQPLRLLQIPLLGNVAGGLPMLALENLQGHVPYLPEGAEDPEELFALKVQGDSMSGAGILDGDIVVVERTPIVENGEIAVAMVGEEATVKRIFREGGRIRLQPENPAYSPLLTDDVMILGKVVACSRSYKSRYIRPARGD